MKFEINIIPENKEDLEEITKEEVKDGLECYFAQCNILVNVKVKVIKQQTKMNKNVIKYINENKLN